MPRKPSHVPFFVRHLPLVLLLICTAHLVASSTLMKDQYPSVARNEMNTHFGLTCVMVFLLCLLFSLVIVDMIYRTHSTFRYVVGLNISVVATGLFISGYLIGFTIEISFAKVTWYTCKMLGIGTRPSSEISDNSTLISSESVEESEKARCDEAIAHAFTNISIDLLIHLVSLPLHIFATAFSWTFSDLYRPRSHEYHD